ncbi:hypothetical protein ACFLSE_02460 [Bacteroidota bacterium]
MTFNIKWEKKGVCVRFRGVVTAQELIDSNNYLISDVNFDIIDYQIFDLLEIEDFKVTPYDISIIGSIDKSQTEFKKDMKVAIVTQDDYVKDIIKEYEEIMIGSNWITKIFDNYESALKWARSK